MRLIAKIITFAKQLSLEILEKGAIFLRSISQFYIKYTESVKMLRKIIFYMQLIDSNGLSIILVWKIRVSIA